jgi:outer membrane autotransporter protein
MNVSGPYVHGPNATYEAEINDHGDSDLIYATGSATINGGTVNVQAEAGNYTQGMRYTILQADGGISGAFSSITDNLPFLNARLIYSGNDIQMILVSTFVSAAQTPNQVSVANNLDVLQPGASGDFADVLSAIAILPDADIRSVLDQFGGEPYADLATIDIQAANQFSDIAWERMNRASDSAYRNQTGREFWSYGLGTWQRQENRNSYLGYAGDTGGIMIGYDKQFDNAIFGFGAGYAQNNLHFLGTPAWDKSDLFNFSLYGKVDNGPLYLCGVVGYNHGWNDVTRTLQLVNLPARSATGSVDGNLLGTFLQTGYNLDIGRWTLTPLAGVRYVNAGMSDASESGANSLNLQVGRYSRYSMNSSLGGKLALQATQKWHAEAYGQWEHEFGDTYSTVAMSFVNASDGFVVSGVHNERDGARVGLIAIGDLTDRISTYINYDAMLRQTYNNQQLNGGVSVKF